jgi:hypothetical protein
MAREGTHRYHGEKEMNVGTVTRKQISKREGTHMEGEERNVSTMVREGR